MLTSGSSAEQRVQIITTASTTTTPRWWCLGRVWKVKNVGGNGKRKFVGGKMDIMGNVDICGNVFCSSEPRFRRS
jgi:hypothetical protein